jgi:AraC-like DNA-binding protein
VQLEATLMNYSIHPAPEPLRDYVEHLWTVAVDRDEPSDLTLKFFVTCAPCLVFQHHNGRSAITHRITNGVRKPCNKSHPTLFIRGPITQPFHCVTEGALTAMGIELKPQALNTLLGIDVAELSDGLVELNAFSPGNLNEQLLNTKSRQHQLALLTGFLMAKARAGRPKDELVNQSLRLMDEKVGSMHVRILLKCLNVSERQFERRFTRGVGLPASFYLRVMRFQETVRLMQAGRFARLTDIAYHLGYTDQSHFIKDIKEFSGSTPKDLSHAVQECAAMRRYQTIVRQRILIRQNSSKLAGVPPV